MCKKAQPLDQFCWRNKAKKIRQPNCKACRRLIDRAFYKRNKSRVAPKKAKRAAQQYEALTELINRIKDVPCYDCCVKYPPQVMDFDHVTDNKIANVSDLRNHHSKQKLLDEIAKCQIVCSNCHRNRTHERRKTELRWDEEY